MKTILLNVFHHDDLYEVYLNGTIIHRIVRFSGNNLQRTISWDDLSEDTKQKVIEKIVEYRRD